MQYFSENPTLKGIKMSKSISNENIYLLQKWRDGVYIFAENDDQELILLKHSDNKFKLIHKFDDSLKHFQTYTFNKNKHLIALLDKHNILHVFSFENELKKLDIKPDSSVGIHIEFDETGKYLCCFDRSIVHNIWLWKESKWESCKIKETQNPGIFMEYNKKDYAYYKVNSFAFRVLTPEIDFEINLYRSDIDKILFNKLLRKPHKTEVKNKGPELRNYASFEKLSEDYQLIKLNNNKTFAACVKDKESRIDIYRTGVSSYKQIETLDKHSGIVKYLYFSDSGTLFSGSSIGKIKVWQHNFNSFKIIHTLEKHSDEISDILADKTTNFLISRDKGNKLIFWKKQTNRRQNFKNLRVVYFDQETIENCHIPFDDLKFDEGKIFFKDQNNDLLFYDFNSFRIGDLDKIRESLTRREQILKSLRSKTKKPVRSIDNEIKSKLKPTQKNKKLIEVRQVDLLIREEIENFRNIINSSTANDKISSDNSPIGRKTGEVIRINVGIDFGTSYTKVAYSRVNPRVVRPLIFEHKLNNVENNFIPSLLFFDKKDNLHIGIKAAEQVKNPEDCIYNFKMLFVSEIDKSLKKNLSIAHMLHRFNKHTLHLEEIGDFKFRLMVCAFLSHVMHETRKKIRVEMDYRPLDLSFNICIPVDYMNNNNILQEFRKIIAAAEFIERIHPEKIIDLKYIYDVFINIAYDNDRTRVYEIPETIAEVASYTTSRRVKAGLHVIIDFGAGTTDISIINIKNPRNIDQQFSFYSSNIINYGFREVDRYKRRNEPEKIEDYIYELWERSHVAWANAYDHHLTDDLSWKGDKVQIFISGGGSQEKLVSEIFCKPRVNREKWERFLHPIEPLPIPVDYQDLGINIPFHRFAVAYGLSNPKPVLRVNDYILPKDSANDTPEMKYRNPYKEADDRLPFRF